jgi:hypothetical protein
VAESSTASFVNGRELKGAVQTYLREAYKGGALPQAVQERVAKVEGFADDQPVPLDWLEKSQCDSGRCTYALRLGQPMYPHMKLIIEESPDGGHPLFRADAHDGHLHAPAGSPDAAPLAALRAINKELTERIEAGWVAAGLPTFKEYLKATLAERKLRAAKSG